MLQIHDDTVWLFDYDLTLYTYKERFVLDSLDKRISLFVQKEFHCSLEEASEIRKDYLMEFGTTLAGLQKKIGTKPDDYFDFIHTEDGLLFPEYATEKIQLLKKLPGKKFIFTNGRADWACKGISKMGLKPFFEDIFDLKKLNWIGKPHISAYQKVAQFLKEKGLQKNQIILLDDAYKNLIPAKEFSWESVLINPIDTEEFPNQVPTILELPQILSFPEKEF